MRPKIKNYKSLALNLLLLLALTWVGWSALDMGRQAWALWREAQDARSQVEELARKKAELEAYIAELESRQGVEREAKSRLNLKLPGEEVAVVVKEEEKKEEAGSAAFWNRVKQFFSSPFK